MRRQWYGKDSELSFRMGVTMFLLAAVYMGFMTVLWLYGVGFVPLAVIAGAMLLAQYYMSDKLVLWSMGAREVSPQEAPKLHATVERLAQLADLPKPRVAIVDTPMPNAFATGRNPQHAVVAVTTGLLNRLDQPEVEAVLGHELTHVRNRDMTVITMASFFASIASYIMQMGLWFGFGYGDDREDRRSGSSAMLVYLAALLVWIISFFLIRALSRYREYAADRGSAVLTGTPSQLASALVKISGVMARIPQQDLRGAEAHNAFFIVPAISGNALMELLSTHPSLEHRLERLRAMERQMEGL